MPTFQIPSVTLQPSGMAGDTTSGSGALPAGLSTAEVSLTFAAGVMTNTATKFRAEVDFSFDNGVTWPSVFSSTPQGGPQWATGRGGVGPAPDPGLGVNFDQMAQYPTNFRYQVVNLNTAGTLTNTGGTLSIT